jgi:demethylmenaquinone methyltransferase/2-methoxy-6-polyprenyl-1,4-benzoquinol methylase
MTMPSVEENIARVAAFYAAQAPEYHEAAYGMEPVDTSYPRLKAAYQAAFRGHSVLEVAAGTGYWTEVVARTARTVLATDVNPWLVESTRNRLHSLSNVQFRVADAYSLETVSESFSAAFAQFWWSHIPRKRHNSFLHTLHSKLQPGALVSFTDHLASYSKGMKHRIDEHGDIYEERILRDGSRFETIKNFPSEFELAGLLNGIASDVTYAASEPEHLWTVSYHVKR